MSSPRVTKIWEGLAEQLHRMGYTGALAKSGIPTCLRWIGRGTVDGKDAVVVDLDSATWATGNRRAVITATPAGTLPVDYADFHTLSHAAGHQLDGSVSLTVYWESTALASPANSAAALATQTGAAAQFHDDLLHILRGQLGAVLDLQVVANGTEPTVNGVNGAGATATFSDAGTRVPYGLAYPGGI